ncbi:MAG: acyl-CoA synthetase, partial [Gammaproteobacteria bacterium]
MIRQPAASHTSWAKTPERSNMFLLRAMTWISLHLGRRAARGVLHPIAAYFLLFAPASRRASRNYLRRVLDRPARWSALYRHFFTFAATIHDRIYLVNRRFNLFDFEIHGEDALRSLLAEGHGVILMGAHLGSFEVIRAIGRKDPDLRVAMVMHEANAQKISALLAAINSESAQDIIGMGQIDSMLKVRERL